VGAGANAVAVAGINAAANIVSGSELLDLAVTGSAIAGAAASAVANATAAAAGTVLVSDTTVAAAATLAVAAVVCASEQLIDPAFASAVRDLGSIAVATIQSSVRVVSTDAPLADVGLVKDTFGLETVVQMDRFHVFQIIWLHCYGMPERKVLMATLRKHRYVNIYIYTFN
jgi:hypothetical protein